MLPVIATACAWRAVEGLAGLTVWPRDGRPGWAKGEARGEQELAALAGEALVRLGYPLSGEAPPGAASPETSARDIVAGDVHYHFEGTGAGLGGIGKS